MRYISTRRVAHAKTASRQISDSDYRKLAAFRASLRKFSRTSEEIVHAAGFTPQQHHALLAIKGFEGLGRPLVKDLAAQLQICHNGTVGLVNRLVAHGFVRRIRSNQDRRGIYLELTRKGDVMLRHLTQAHRVELRHIGPTIRYLLTELAD